MVQLATFVSLALASSSAFAAPITLNKRIAQVISASTQKWEAACSAAGGAQKCNPLSVAAFTTLLAAAGPCDQQNAADNMMDLAKTLNNNADLIKLTQIFVQQPRNSPNSVSIPYCQQAPKNKELSGLFQCQFQGSKAQTFVGGLTVGQPGTVPFGLKSLSPLGSCAAHPQGPIADGTQLVDLTQDPGVPGQQKDSATAASTAQGTKTSEAAVPGASPTDAAASSTTSMDNGNTDSADASSSASSSSASDPATSPTSVAAAAAATPTAKASGTSTDATTGDFHKQNAADAQALNAKFATLTASSACTDGENACVAGGFAQCVGGKFVVTQCASGSTCAALPLVLKAGTSIACATDADVKQRIADAAAQ